MLQNAKLLNLNENGQLVIAVGEENGIHTLRKFDDSQESMYQPEFMKRLGRQGDVGLRLVTPDMYLDENDHLKTVVGEKKASNIFDKLQAALDKSFQENDLGTVAYEQDIENEALKIILVKVVNPNGISLDHVLKDGTLTKKHRSVGIPTNSIVEFRNQTQESVDRIILALRD